MFFDYRAFARHPFLLSSGIIPAFDYSESWVQLRLFSTSQPRAVWYKASAQSGLMSRHSFAGVEKSSVVIKLSGHPRNPRGHSSFWHATHAIHVAFAPCFIYLVHPITPPTQLMQHVKGIF